MPQLVSTQTTALTVKTRNSTEAVAENIPEEQDPSIKKGGGGHGGDGGGHGGGGHGSGGSNGGRGTGGNVPLVVGGGNGGGHSSAPKGKHMPGAGTYALVA